MARGTQPSAVARPAATADGVPDETEQRRAAASSRRSYAAQRISATLELGAASPLAFTAPETVFEQGAKYLVTVKTTKGDIELTIDGTTAPVNANAVLFLAQEGYYDNAPIDANAEQVKAVIMGSAQFSGNPGFDCGTESAGSDFSVAGGVALNPLSPERNTAQLVFFYEPAAFNGQLTSIGQITSGLDIAKSLQGAQGENKADRILSVTVKKL